jgi:ZIP family zinc transporter
MTISLYGLGFIFLMTTLGAATVFFAKNSADSKKYSTLTLGFAAGIMIAASIWSLLLPAMDLAREQNIMPACGGFILGIAFLLLLDMVLPHLHPQTNCTEGIKSNLARSSLLFLAVTIHNIPEGMAVGLSFALALQSPSPELLSQAVILALGIGIQNFPEGAAVTLPLRAEGFSRLKAFAYGTLSGAVEPIFGLFTIFIAERVLQFMPWLLSFAAGSMLYVVVEELIPEARLDRHSNLGTLSVMAGFLLMMLLDTTLG